MSTSLGSFFITNTTLSRFSDRPADAAGLLQIRKQVGTSATKFELGYGWGANRAFQLARVSHDKRLSADYRYHIGIEDDTTRSQPLALIGAVYKMVGPLALGVNVSMNPSGLKAGLMLSTSVGTVGSSEGYALAKPGSANQSQVQARVFLDNNLSGVFDKGDTLLPDVRFKADGHGVTGKTGAKGTCVLNKLESDRRVCLSLNEDSFEDPSWMSVGGPFVVLPRAGARVKVDFPVIATAEIDGRAAGPKSGPQSYSGFKATLVSSKGVASYSSELDSEDRFVFSRVVPGVYTMRLEDPQGIVVYEDMFSVQSGEIVSGFNLLVTAAKLPKSYGGSRPDSELPAPEGPPPPGE